MCGRFGLAYPHRLKAAGVLDAARPDVVGEDAAALLEPRYNIAPTQPVVAARTHVRDWVRDRATRDRYAKDTSAGRAGGGSPERRVDVLRWGSIPA